MTITVSNVNEAPTAITAERLVLAPGQFNLGALSVTADPDQGQDAADYAFALASGGDNDLFEIIGGDLVFKSTSSFKEEGETYDLTINVTDNGGTPDPADDVTVSLDLMISQGGVYVLVDPNDSDNKTYSGGAGLLAENADADADGVDIDTTGDGTNDDKGIEIGTLGREGLDTTETEFGFIAASQDNDNDFEFALVNDTLYYIGADSGDVEANDTLTIEVITKDSNDADIAGTAERYTINLTNIDDNAPVFVDADNTPIPSGQAAAGVTASVAEVLADQASATNTDANITITANAEGAAGNAIEVKFVIGTAAGAGVESVLVSGNTITVTLNAEGATDQAIVDAINAHTEASALVTAEIVASDVTTAQTLDLAGGWIVPLLPLSTQGVDLSFKPPRKALTLTALP